jgi:hypothetical protein
VPLCDVTPYDLVDGYPRMCCPHIRLMVEDFDLEKLIPIYKITRCQNPEYHYLNRYKFNSIFLGVSVYFVRITLTFWRNALRLYSGSKTKWSKKIKTQAVSEAEIVLFSAYFLLVSCLTCFSNLKIEAVLSSETTTIVWGATLYYIPEDDTLHSDCRENQSQLTVTVVTDFVS